MVRWIEAGDRAQRIAAGVLGLLLIALFLYGWGTDWFPWSRECDDSGTCHLLPGETFGAIEQAWGNVYDGPKSWLIYRHGTAIYIHNQNLGGYVVVLTALLGALTLAPAGMITAVGFVGGVAYGYLLVARLSRSALLALLFLALLASQVYLSTMLGLNLLRAWHWLPLFGVAYHALGLFGRQRLGVRQLAAVAFLAWIGFAIGYEFYAFVVATAAMAVVVSGFVRPSRRWVLFGALLILPVVLRQIQVAGGVGPTVWATDLYYTAGLKSPLLRSLLPVPPADDILAWYATHELFHGVPNNEPIADTLALFIRGDRWQEWLENLGYLTTATAALGLVLTPVLFVRRWGRPEGFWARTVLAVAVGQVIGFLAFGSHALLYFIVKFSMPLIVAPIVLAVALVLRLLLDGGRRRAVRLGGAVLAVALVAERAYIEWTTIAAMEVRARPAEARWGGYTFVVGGGPLGELAPIVLTIAMVVGAALLIWLAWAFVRARPDADADTPHEIWTPWSAAPRTSNGAEAETAIASGIAGASG